MAVEDCSNEKNAEKAKRRRTIAGFTRYFLYENPGKADCVKIFVLHPKAQLSRRFPYAKIRESPL